MIGTKTKVISCGGTESLHSHLSHLGCSEPQREKLIED